MNRFATIACLAAALATSACATYDPATDTRTEVERAIGRCIAVMAVGAIVGGVVGNNTGRGNAKRGMLTGAAAGGAVCAVMMAVASERDKQRIIALQNVAAASGGVHNQAYFGDDGKRRNITVAANEVAADNLVGANGVPTGPCRRLNTTISVEGAGSASLPAEYSCRNADATYTRVRLAPGRTI